ncbi:MAG: TIGR03960 family B12-binding radical SAM protein [Dehalococcoidia bacterium]
MAVVRNLDGVFARVQKPARYTGGEWNSAVKDWDACDVRVAFAYPDLYDIGMSNLGLGILYDIVNRREGMLAERVFAPWSDLEAIMRAEGIPLWSLETRHPLSAFDMLGFSLSYEGTYTNILNMLDLAGLPVLAGERTDAHPLVICGGSGALNPDALADFIDVFVLGDGEETIVEIVDFVREWKRQGRGTRDEMLYRLSRIWGVYVPRFYAPRYHDDGTIRAIEPVHEAAPAHVVKRFVQELPPPLTKPIVPYLQTVHDRMAIEIQRGCTQGCRFCQAGMIYRPRLERSPEEVVAAAKELQAQTGYDELSLVSLSTTDHSRIVPMVDGLRQEFGDGLTISLPSMRVDSFSVRVSEAVATRGKHSITFAPEAGTERLRMTINKVVSDDDLYTAVDNAFRNGWTNVKMYFMVGQPTETHEDIEGIVTLAKRVREIGRSYHGGRARVRVSTSNFIPKAHTPFQWASQARAEVLRPRHYYLREALKKAGVAFTWEDPEHSLLEAVLSRGDRRLGKAIHRAWQAGARFDAWHEHYDWPRWERALQESGLDPEFYAYRERGLREVFPWSHINIGVSESYLRSEWMKTLRGETTADCHKQPCNVCGVQNQNAEDCLNRFDLRLAQQGKPPKDRTGLIQPIEMFTLS